MKLDNDLPDRGPGAPVRPGESDGIALFLFAAVLVIGGAGTYAFGQLEEGWYGRLIEAVSPEQPVLPDRQQRPETEEAMVPGKLQPAGSPGDWVSDDDYPPEALRNGWQGTVGFALDVDTDGQPRACHVTRSSGTKYLDDAACSLLMKRARFIPARDETGRPVSATFRSRFTWRIPG